VVLGQLALQVGREPDTSQRPGLRKEGFRIEHIDDSKDQLRAMGVALRAVPEARDVKDGRGGGERVCYDIVVVASKALTRTQLLSKTR
jgi:hypothetical protein